MKLKKIDGKQIANNLLEEVKNKITSSNITPNLVVILVENDDSAASKKYVKNKENAAESVGIKSSTIVLDKSTSKEQLLELIDELNGDENVDAILVQLPLPDHIDEESVINRIDPSKDVDCFTSKNIGELMTNPHFELAPCTPRGIVHILKQVTELEGKDVVIIGRSNIVGKPLVPLLLKENCTVTETHSKTKNIKQYTQLADIVIVATGHPSTIDKSFVKDDAILIDVGINVIDGKLIGDIDKNINETNCLVTPVPGGVGPMTVAMLMNQAYDLAKKKVMEMI